MADGPAQLIAAPPDALARVVFTGRLAAMSRRAAVELVRRRGGRVLAAVSGRTSLLVVGAGGWPLLPDGGVSRQLARAEALEARGAPIRIVPEEEFLEFAGVRAERRRGRRAFDRAQAAGALGLDPATLRRWESLGLVHGSADGYDFRDLVGLRTIAVLLARGAAPAAIAAGLRGLGRVLEVDRPLAQLTLITGADDLLAEIDGAFVDSAGQLRLPFRLDGEAPPPLPLAGPDGADMAGADEWFAQALRMEDDECLEEAAAAHRRAIALRDDFVEAHATLGRVLQALGRLDEAAGALRRAVDLEPDLAVAWFDLAAVETERGRDAEAIACLRRVLAFMPDHADARYELALRLDAADAPGAPGAWRSYVELDPHGPWADVARARLAALGACS